MTDGETPAAQPATTGEAKPKRARKRAAAGTGTPRAPKAEPPAKPAAAPAPQPPSATPAPSQLNEVIMSQTAESLAQLSANLASAMTRANQVFSTAFLEQSKDPTAWKHDPLGVQVALNEVWGHLAMQPETLRDAHAQLWQRYGEIWQRHSAQMFTGNALSEADMPRDKRFAVDAVCLGYGFHPQSELARASPGVTPRSGMSVPGRTAEGRSIQRARSPGPRIGMPATYRRSRMPSSDGPTWTSGPTTPGMR